MKMIAQLVIGLFALVSSLPAFAAGFPQEVPLSRARMEFMAKTMINGGFVGVQGDSVSGKWADFVPYKGPKGDLAAIAAELKKVQLDYTVDPTEEVSSFAHYSYQSPDNHGFTLFAGQKDWNYVKDKDGNWSPPAGALAVDNMEFQMLPIHIEGLVYAYIIQRDSSGRQIGFYDLSNSGHVSGNYLILNQQVAQEGTSGELYVRKFDGTLAVYGLDGMIRAVVSMSHEIDSSIASIRDAGTNPVEIAYREGDSIVTAKYTVDTVVTVRFGGQNLGNLRNVVVSEKRALEANPAGGVSWEPSKTITFKPKAGEEWVILFEKFPYGKG